MKRSNDCRSAALRIAYGWSVSALCSRIVRCPCAGCAAIVASELNLDRARRIAGGEMVVS